jgi:uncharacterized protein (TIGR00661 family)
LYPHEMYSEEKQKILVCPLEWGLGHVTRCVPVIKELQKNNFHVLVGISARHRDFFSSFISDVEYVIIPSFTIKYYCRNAFISILLQLPKFFLQMIKDHFILSQMIKKKNISLVISDNRYGLYNYKIKSVLITHQVFMCLPKNLGFLRSSLYKVTAKMINRFDECWIPDINSAPQSYSGKLSHDRLLPSNYKYIGILSRFKDLKLNKMYAVMHQALVILSGPEPQRTQFEESIYSQAESLPLKIIMIRGTPGAITGKSVSNIAFHNHINDNDFLELIATSEFIICRAGYSTIMDLLVSGKTALLVPTPGQTEQEYLAEYLSSVQRFISVSQKEFNFAKAIENLKSFKKDRTFHPVENSILPDLISGMRTKGVS